MLIYMKDQIYQLVAAIIPHDAIEQTHQGAVLTWIKSGADLYRIKKPDVPPKHLVSYTVVIDRVNKQLLLVHHKNAQLLLPPGGHVEINEHPAQTAKRELQEELHLEAQFIQEKPFFITVTETINNDKSHTDVSFWYLLKGDAEQKLAYDEREMSGYEWKTYEELLKLEQKQTDPHLHRFVQKLRKASII